MPKTKAIFATMCLAALAETVCAQVLSPPEIQDLGLRALQQKHLTELKTVATTIAAQQFPYRFYFSRTLDLSERQQQRSDQRCIRFDKFRNQTVLQITGNYYASYSAELMQKPERARRTMQDVMLPILQAAVPALGGEEKLQAFALEISHHVRRKVLGVSTENAENVAFILPRAAARRLISASSQPEREAALREGMLFVDGKPSPGWAREELSAAADGSTQPDEVAEAGNAARTLNATLSGNARASSLAAKPAAIEPGSGTSPAMTAPVLSAGGGAVVPATPLPAAAPANANAQDVTPEALRKQQSACQEILDRLVRELDKDAHFVSYAPPAFVVFHKGIYLQLSITTVLRESQPGSQYRAAALAFDEHVSHLIRPVLAAFKGHVEFDGIDFSTSVRPSGAASSAGSAGAVEFIFPLAWLRAYEQYDATGQQLINQAYVLINGERVSLDLQSAEAGLAGVR
jgi:hypothetical protein